jgi:outer membrane lipopolysaccharide assembly protein LptE/RlpB
MKTVIKIILSTSVVLFLSACGGGKKENWGIDYQRNGVPIAKCVNNSQDAADAQATVVPAGSTVSKSSQDTVVRVWHFQNSTEAVCVVSGEALLVAGGQS